MPLNTWIYLAGTFDGTNAALYVNSGTTNVSNGANPRAFNTNAVGLRFVPDDNSALLVGCLGQFNNGRLTSYIDEVAIYTNVLTQSRIIAHKDAAPGGSYSPTVLADNPAIYLRLDESPYTPPPQSTFPNATN